MWSFSFINVVLITLSIISTEGKGVTPMKKNKSMSHFKQTLLYGGKVHKITDAPYMALLYYVMKSKEMVYCGACIIHERFLLTAGHCYFPNIPSFVRVGTDVLDEGTKYKIEKIIVHPGYNTGAIFNNDIAVIKLRRKLRFNERVNLIKMAPKNSVFESNAVMKTMGFGKTPIFNKSNRLLIIDVPYVNEDDCMRRRNHNVTESMLCAGGVRGKSSCLGDSGGPLVYGDKLVGLVSYGDVPCGGGDPVVYASIPALRGFVDSTIRSEILKDKNKKKV